MKICGLKVAMTVTSPKRLLGDNVHFEKLPQLPKGSDIYETVREEMKHEHETLRHDSHLDACVNSDTDSPPRSRANSQSRVSPAQLWFTARARLDKPSLYKTVVLATAKWKR